MAVACVAADVFVEMARGFAAASASAAQPDTNNVYLGAREASARPVVGAFLAVLVKSAFQAGRLWGHWERGRLVRNFLWRFNWYGNMPDVAYVQQERSEALVAWGARVVGIALVAS